MISYKPLWELMDAKDMTTYTLRNMGKEYCLSGSTIARLQAEVWDERDNRYRARGEYGENQMVPDDENPYYAKLAKAPTYKLR